MVHFAVDAGQVQASAAEVARAVGRLRDETAALDRGLATLDAAWQGPAAEGFRSSFASWRSVHGRLEDALDEIRGSLVVASQIYEDAEAQAARAFSG